MELLHETTALILLSGYFILWKIKQRELYKREGIQAKVLAKSVRPTQRYFAQLEKIMTVAIVGILLVQFIFPDGTASSKKNDLFDLQIQLYIGSAMALVGLAICRIAQVTIGKSWRVGIDEYSKPGLITHGIYRYIRNPTYTGLFVFCIGIWMVLPTLLLSYWLLAFFMMIEFQVRCEEEYLIELYKEDYKTYCHKTKRYIPFIY